MSAVESLPSPGRFLLRGLAAGLSPDALGEVLGEQPQSIDKRLRATGRAIGVATPPPSAGRDALLAALAPVVDATRNQPGRRPATGCPQDDVAREIAAGRLAGPLLLATLEHVGDCPPCLARLVRHRAEGNAPPVDAPRRAARIWRIPRGCVVPLIGVLVGTAVVIAAWQFLR